MINLRNILVELLNNIDSGNSNISEQLQEEIIEFFQKLTSLLLTKAESANYINVSTATFDNYIRRGWVPKGTKRLGINKLFWNKTDLDKFLEEGEKEMTLFGRDYEEIGSSKKGLILKNSGKIKLLWGNKLVDLLDKNGNINAKEQTIIKITSRDSLSNTGIYFLENDSESCFIVYYDKNHFLEIKNISSLESNFTKAEQLPTYRYAFRSIVSKIKKVGNYYQLYFKELLDNVHYYTSGEILVIYITYKEVLTPIYFLVIKTYNYKENFVTCLLNSLLEDESILFRITDFECFLFQMNNNNSLLYNNVLTIGKVDNPYREFSYGIESKLNIFYTAHFDYDNSDDTSLYPRYTSALYNKLLEEDKISDTTLVPYGLIKLYAVGNSNTLSIDLMTLALIWVTDNESKHFIISRKEFKNQCYEYIYPVLKYDATIDEESFKKRLDTTIDFYTVAKSIKFIGE